MNDSIVLAVVTFGVIAWVVLAAIEAVYNRCKQRQLVADYKAAIEALSGMILRHPMSADTYDCECDAYTNARAVIRKYHERGGK
jgi:hypothetical protein